MAYLWDSNILRHYNDAHPLLLANLERIGRDQVFIPIIVYAEQMRGRIDGLLKAESAHVLQRFSNACDQSTLIHRRGAESRRGNAESSPSSLRLCGE
jgi:hypothetical protein